MTNNNKSLVVTIALSILVLLPSVLFSQWFPLDFGGIFEIGDLFQEKLPWILSPYNGSGRYFPVYWLFNSLQYFLFGTNTVPYFLVQAVILGSSIWLTCRLARQLIGDSRLLVLLPVLLFINSPIAENSSTLGKAEPLAYLLIVLIITLFVGSRVAANEARLRTQFLVISLFVLALLTKETSLAVIGFGVIGLTLTLVFKKLLKLEPDITPKHYLKFLGALFAGLLISKIPYLIYWNPDDSPTYLDYKITGSLILANLKFYVEQQPDVLLFLVLAFVLLSWAVLRLLLQRGAPRNSLSISALIVVISLYGMGLAYYLVLLAWRWPMAYYMLIPSIIFRVTTIYALFYLTAAQIQNKPVVSLIYTIIGACVLYSAAYVFYVIGSQISYSRLYTDAITHYVRDSDGRQALVMENYPFYAEQVTGTHLILRFAHKHSYRIGGIADLLDGSASGSDIRHLLGISEKQMLNNINALPVRDDYILVFTGRKIATWFLRGVTPFFNSESQLKRLGAYDLQLVAQREISLPSVFFNIWTGTPEIANSALGFELYKVTNSGARFFWLNRMTDGWIGEQASLVLNPNFEDNPVIRVSAPNFSIPNSVLIKKNGEFYAKVDLSTTNEVVVKLDPVGPIVATYNFLVEKTVAPIEAGLNSDTRKLGILINLERRP